nr:copper amine oxidase N-terminal domain-containing protein [Anaerosolibacter carboniphilus]
MTAVRFVPQADGAYRTVKLGGTYNSKEETFEFYTDSFSLYSIVKTDKISKIKLTVDSNDYSVDEVNKLTDVAPIIKDNRTLVPIRIVAEALGAKVDWNQDLRLVTITLDGQVLELTIDQLIEDMDVPAKMIDNRTMVPIRYISEKLGAYVLWFGETKVVEIIK